MYLVHFGCLCAILMSCIRFTKQQMPPLSPCANIFHYETDGLKWFGILEIKTNPFQRSFQLNITMSVAAELPSRYPGKIELLENRIGVSVRYKIHFPRLHIIPNLMNIKFNNLNICTGTAAKGSSVTEIRLHYSFTTRDGNSQPSSYDMYENIPPKRSPPKYYHHMKETFALSTTSTHKPTNALYGIGNDVSCGKHKLSNRLIVGGNKTKPGEWPWVAALYKNEVNKLDFICAGSLISNRHVVTAGHCILQNRKDRIKNEDFLIKVGVHNLQDFEDENTKTCSVLDIKLHPSYDAGIDVKGDIAVLVISFVEFSNFVIPICLWNENNDLSLVEGENAIVVGWGKDENGLLVTPKLLKVLAPIVSTEKCISSRNDFKEHTSNLTICAGSRDNKGPCNGDSGGGLYIWRHNKWMLRGIVSQALPGSKDPFICNLDDFVIFTDSAKYLKWIYDIVNNKG